MGNDYFYACKWDYDSNHRIFNGNIYDEKIIFNIDDHLYFRDVYLYFSSYFSNFTGRYDSTSGGSRNYDAINDDDFYVDFCSGKTWTCDGNGRACHRICSSNWSFTCRLAC